MNACLHNKKKIFSLIIFFLILSPLSSNVFSAKKGYIQSFSQPSHEYLSSTSYDKSNKIIRLSYQFKTPLISTISQDNISFSQIAMNNMEYTQIMNSFQIPYKKIRVLLPQNTQVENLTFTNNHEHLLLDYPLMILQGSFNQSFDDNSGDNVCLPFGTNNIHENTYPKENVEIIGVGKQYGYSLLLLKIYPVQLRSNSEIIFSSSVNITIRCEKTDAKDSLLRDKYEDKKMIIDTVENPSMVQNYEYKPVEDLFDENPSANYRYVVITSSSLEKYFEPLISYKNEFISAISINISYIHDHFAGVDLQEKIRNCIKYVYLNWQTDYVLLGGDVNVIPYRGLRGHAIDHTGEILHDDTIPADVYYSALDGNWDNDGDGIYGENAGNSTGEEADFFSEVSLGRAPVENEVEIGTFINKIITYETSEKPLKILLHQSGLNTRNIPDSTVIPDLCAGWIPSNYEIEKLYQVNEIITPSMWMEHFADDNLIVQHTGNGEADRYYLTWPTYTFSTFESLSLLENNFYPIHTSVACNSGSFEKENDCVAETLLLNPYGGASACLFNSRRGFTSSTNAHKYSGELIEEQFRHIFALDTRTIGEVHQLAKEHFSMDMMQDNAYRWCYYTLNLLGDPEMPVLDTRSSYLNPSTYYVDDDYSESTTGWQVTCFNSIQDAIDNADDWDIVRVSEGVYDEQIVIDKTIELIGENKFETILKNQSIRIIGNRIKLNGFTISGLDKSKSSNRIIVLNSNYVTISECIIKDNEHGIYLSDVRNVFIINNEFTNNLKGIFTVVKTGNVYITDNNFTLDEPDSYGVYSMAKGKLILQNNSFASSRNFYNCSYGIYSESDTEIFSNSVKDCTIGIWLTGGNHLITDNDIEGNDHLGIYSSFSSVSISNNSFQENGNYFLKSYHNPFEPGGLLINGTINDFCRVNHNLFEGNKGYGVFIKGLSSFNNRIVNNDFVENSRSAGFRNSRIYWNENFWDKGRDYPKFIFGLYQFKRFLFFPLLQTDLNPARVRVTLI